jgi:hypothetical protein
LRSSQPGVALWPIRWARPGWADSIGSLATERTEALNRALRVALDVE